MSTKSLRRRRQRERERRAADDVSAIRALTADRAFKPMPTVDYSFAHGVTARCPTCEGWFVRRDGSGAPVPSEIPPPIDSRERWMVSWRPELAPDQFFGPPRPVTLRARLRRLAHLLRPPRILRRLVRRALSLRLRRSAHFAAPAARQP